MYQPRRYLTHTANYMHFIREKDVVLERNFWANKRG